MMVIILQRTYTKISPRNFSLPFVRSLTACQVASSVIFSLWNAAWVGFTAFLHRLYYGRSSSLTSSSHAFRCSVLIPNGTSDQFYLIHLTDQSIYYSFGTVFSTANGSMATGMFYPGEGIFQYRFTCSIAIIYMVTLVGSGSLFLESLYHTFI